MIELLSLAVAILGGAILLFGLALLIANRVQARRLGAVVGPYLVRVGPVNGRGRDGDDLATRFDDIDEARSAAKAAVLESDGDVAGFVLGAREDGQWDVVDRVDVLRS